MTAIFQLGLLQDNRRAKLCNLVVPQDDGRKLARRGGAIIRKPSKDPVVAGTPMVQILADDSDELAYFRKRTGYMEALAIADDSPRTLQLLREVLADSIAMWRGQGVTGLRFTWPVFDVDVSSVLTDLGIQVDAIVAVQTLGEVEDDGIDPPRDVYLRQPSTDQIDILTEIHMSVLDAHIPHSPFARRIPAVGDRFRERALRSIMNEGDRNHGESLVLVACDMFGRILAMAEVFVQDDPVTAGTVRIGEGTWAYIHSFGVRPDLRRHGIGTHFLGLLVSELKTRGIRQLYLWFSPYNASARDFWPSRGFVPVWRIYQRHDLLDGPLLGADV